MDPRVVTLLDDAQKLYTLANVMFKVARESEERAHDIVKKNGCSPEQVEHEIPDQERRRRTMECPGVAWGTPRPKIVEGSFE